MINIEKVGNISVYVMFFLMPYLGIGWPAHLFVLSFFILNVRKTKLQNLDVILGFLFISFLILKTLQCNFSIALAEVRYYFGFFIIYLFFRSIKFEFPFSKFISILSISIIFEAILINTIISPQVLPNFPPIDPHGISYQTYFFGFYQRPYSIGANASNSGTILIVLLLLNYMNNIANSKKNEASVEILALIAIILLASGSGIMLYFVYLLFKLNPFKNILRIGISIVFCAIIFYLIIIVNIGKYEGLKKISAEYFVFLYNYKINIINETTTILKNSYMGFFYGEELKDVSKIVIGSDFSWNNMFRSLGYFGIFFFVLVLTSKISKGNLGTILIFLIGAVHYGAMFALPGQILFAYLLSTTYLNKSEREKQHSIVYQ